MPVPGLDPGIVAGIRVFTALRCGKDVMAGTSPAMTWRGSWFGLSGTSCSLAAMRPDLVKPARILCVNPNKIGFRANKILEFARAGFRHKMAKVDVLGGTSDASP